VVCDADTTANRSAGTGRRRELNGLLMAVKFSRWSAWAVLCGLLLLYIAFFSVLSIRCHQTLHTYAFDLGNADQALWNTAHGRPFHFTNWRGLPDLPLKEDSRLGMHFEPVYLLIAPIYWLWSDVRALLILQTVALALGAVPVFLLARLRLGSGLCALVFAMAYLLWPAVEGANLVDFHAITLAVPLLLAAFYLLQTRRYHYFLACAVLAMSCKEDVPLLVFMMGVYTLAVRRAWRWGLATAGLAAIWFYVAMFVVVPHFTLTGQSPYLARYSYLGNSLPQIAYNLLSPAAWSAFFPRGVEYLLQAIAYFQFSPLLSPETLFLAAPSWLINVLSANTAMQLLDARHYAAPLVPFIIAAAIEGLARLKNWFNILLERETRVPVYLAALLLFVGSLGAHRHYGYSPLSLAFWWPPFTEHERLLDKFEALIPPTASVAAQANLNPHFSQRESLFISPLREGDYILVDIATVPYNRNIYLSWFRQNIVGGRDFGILAAEDGYILLQRGAGQRPLPEKFYSFIRVENPEIQHPLTATFGSEIEFLGFNLRDERETFPGGGPYYELFFRAQRKMQRDYLLSLYLVDYYGTVLASGQAPQPALVWYPTSKWQVGETIKIRANVELWSVERPDQYTVALGIVEDESNPGATRRLLPLVAAPKLLIRPATGEGQLLQLATFVGTLAGFRPIFPD
jgi:uncharacterized membrane protein